ncbi:MAG: 4-phosphoerythronate dehydrogenase [Muribaculaceae bacterium]|nr:4-phosphoerythronate dehydrogenase [Muribaculaceae bacterium]
MKIIIDNKIPFIRQRLEPVADVTYASPDSFTPALVKDADALVVRTRTRCDSALLAGSDVSMVMTATIGTDHIDAGWCEANGITVSNAAGCNAPGVAQYVWSGLLQAGFDPARHTLGIVGKGNIGSIVADWGRKAGVRVIVCDPPRQRAGFTDEDYLPLETLLEEADAITLHTPLTREGVDSTFHLIGEGELGKMKPGSILVNASRGEVVDNGAWAKRLKESPSDIAIIDVWEGEPSLNPDLLRRAMIATPHIAGYSRQGKERATRMALEALERHFHISADKSGLCGPYMAPEGDISLRDVADSYDPMADTAPLKENPAAFEALRSDYSYREEPTFRN